jgi:predicted transcriptional regulator
MALTQWHPPTYHTVSDRHRRDSTEITYSILKSVVGGQKKTRIMYRSDLNHKQLNLYLEALAGAELLGFQPTGRFYFATERGLEFTRAFEHYRETKDLLQEQERVLTAFLTSNAEKTTVEVRPEDSWHHGGASGNTP